MFQGTGVGGGLIGKFGKLVPSHNFRNIQKTRFFYVSYVGTIPNKERSGVPMMAAGVRISLQLGRISLQRANLKKVVFECGE